MLAERDPSPGAWDTDGIQGLSGEGRRLLPMTGRPAPPASAGDARLVGIRVLTREELHAAAVILAQGMLDNPLHVRAFGSSPVPRERRLLRFLGGVIGHVEAHGKVLGAFAGGELVGILGMMKPGRCRPALRDRLRLGCLIVAGNPPATVLRIRRWLSVWARNDPAGPHWHIGPLAVAEAYRRRGIGRRLMMHCCEQIDAVAAAAYLETDLARNVTFYETLGFAVIRRETVLGVPNWFMLRPPSPGRPDEAAASPV